MEVIHHIAHALHEDWRNSQMNDDGTYEPVWKKIEDNKFIDNLQYRIMATVRINVAGDYEIDIANTSFIHLSADWQEENIQTAKVVYKILQVPTPLSRNEIGDIMHNEWLKRNSWAKDSDLDIPFEDLPIQEQNADIRKYSIGKNIFERVKGASFSR